MSETIPISATFVSELVAAVLAGVFQWTGTIDETHRVVDGVSSQTSVTEERHCFWSFEAVYGVICRHPN